MDYNQKQINNQKDKITMPNASQDSNNNQLKNREFNINSETIASFVIEKLISLAITDAKRNEIEAEIPKKCFSYVTNIINNFIKLEYLPYDRDDRNILLPYSNNKNINKKKKSDKILGNVICNNNLNNDENVDNISNSQNNFLNKSLSNNEIIEQLHGDSSMDDPVNNDSIIDNNENENNIGSKIIKQDVYEENDIFKTNDNGSTFNLEENFGHFFDNKFFGVNDWNICEEPVIITILIFKFFYF